MAHRRCLPEDGYRLLEQEERKETVEILRELTSLTEECNNRIQAINDALSELEPSLSEQCVKVVHSARDFACYDASATV